jgi:hypothetical protein
VSRSSTWLLAATSVFVAVGCGGATNGSTRDGNGNGAGTSGSGGSAFKPNPPAPGCPAVLPSAGSSCTGNLACTYPSPTSMSICDPQPYAECFNGVWQISQTVTATDCGWMPPDPPQVCPAIPPTAGSPCTGNAYCEYRNPAGSCPPFYSLSCGDNGTWLYGGPLILCNPPGAAGAGPGPNQGGEGPNEGGYGPVPGAGGEAGWNAGQGGVGGAR